jgi:multidrug efflux pump subunit AcrB
MRVAMIIIVLLAAVGGGAFYATRRVLDREQPPPPPATFRVTVEATGRVAENERKVALPLEEKVAAVPGVTRLRTRTLASRVELEVWVRPGTVLEVPGATVSRLDLPSRHHWVVGGERRPPGVGEVCGREDPLPTVSLDPLRLQALHLSALAVDRALKGAAGLEPLAATEVAPTVRVRDVATVELARPPPSCLAFAPEPSYLVSADHFDLPEATELEVVTRIELEGAVPKLESVTPVAVTQQLPAHVTLWFMPRLDPPQRASVLRELQKAGAQVRSIEGARRLRVVLSGADREQLLPLARRFAAELQRRPGAELVVEPAESQPYLNVKVDHERAAAMGVPEDEVAALVKLARGGHVHDGVRVTVPLAEPEHLGALGIRDRRLADVVAMTVEPEPVELLRVDRTPALEVVAYGLDRKAVRAVPVPQLPPGVRLEFREEL